MAEWIADLPDEVAVALGINRRCLSESTIRRLRGLIDADRLDAVLGGFVQRRGAATTPVGRRRVLAVDGKTVRGSRHIAYDGAEVPGQHLLAVIDQHARVVLGQVTVNSKPDRFTPLLVSVTTLDLAGMVITADALHTQREHVADRHACGAHWVL